MQESHHTEENRERETRTVNLNQEDRNERMLDEFFNRNKDMKMMIIISNHDVIEDWDQDETMDDEDDMVEDPDVEEDEENYENKDNDMKLRQDEQQDLSDEEKNSNEPK